MAVNREQILSEFIDAWNAGERPDAGEHIERAPTNERGELAEEIRMFLAFAPTPAYGEEALEAIRGEPVVQEAFGAARERGDLLPRLLRRLRERRSLTTAQVAGELVADLGLPDGKAVKAASYLDRLEAGDLEPSRVNRRVFGVLARVFGVTSEELEGSGGFAGPRAAPVFRAMTAAAEDVEPHLEVLADALAAPGGENRDEVDDLFLGGR